MTLRAKVESAAGFVILLLLGLGAWGWIAERDARVKAEAVQQAQKLIVDQAAKDREQHVKDDAARDAATAAQLAAMAKLVSQIKTPAQIVGWSQAQLEQAIKGIQITLPAPTADNPHPQASIAIPEESLPGLRNTIEKCKECDVKLETAKADLDSRAEQQKLADTQIQALKTENKSLAKAVKGGSFLQRIGKAVKFLVIGAAAGAIALCGSGHCR